MPLEAELAAPFLHHGGDVVPVERWVEHLGEVAADRHSTTAHVDMVVELRQLERFVGHIVDAPGRPHGELHQPGQVEPERDGEAGTLVALAVAAGDAVHGEHHDLDAGSLGARHHLAVQPAILVEVELVDLRPVADPPGFLEADRAQRGHAEHRAELGRRRRHGALALMMEQPLQRSRRAVERHGQLLAHDRHRHVDLLDAPQHVGDEVAVLKGAGVAAIGRFVVRPAVDVVKDRLRQPSLGEAAKIVKIVAALNAHLANPWKVMSGRGGRVVNARRGRKVSAPLNIDDVRFRELMQPMFAVGA